MSYVFVSRNNFLSRVPIWEGTTITTATHDVGYELFRRKRRAAYGPLSKRVKLDEISSPLFKFRGILLFRNPWDAIFSLWQHKKARNMTRSIRARKSQFAGNPLTTIFVQSSTTNFQLINSVRYSRVRRLFSKGVQIMEHRRIAVDHKHAVCSGFTHFEIRGSQGKYGNGDGKGPQVLRIGDGSCEDELCHQAPIQALDSENSQQSMETAQWDV